MTNFLKGIIDEMKPKSRRGGQPGTPACPHCGADMSPTGELTPGPAGESEILDQPAMAAEFDQTPGGGYNPDGTFPQT